jgi:hypothetical protein
VLLLLTTVDGSAARADRRVSKLAEVRRPTDTSSPRFDRARHGQPPAPSRQIPIADTFVLVLIGVGLLLPLAVEFIYLRDLFGTRMNTVFKFYFQAWALLALAAAL